MRSAQIVSKLSEEEKASESVRIILDEHFDRYSKGNMDKLIANWSAGGTNAVGLEEAKICLHNVANYSAKKFDEFLEEIFPVVLGESADVVFVREFLKILSSHATGELRDDDPIFLQSRTLSNLSNDELKRQIGKYMKSKTQEYLSEKFAVKDDASAIANDSSPAPSVAPFEASSLIGKSDRTR
jgi:hypothetical protein